MTSPRIKRWTLLLTAYDYTIEFVPGKDNCFADFLSRNPVEEQPTTEEKETLQVLFTQEGVINSDVVSVETKKILYSVTESSRIMEHNSLVMNLDHSYV